MKPICTIGIKQAGRYKFKIHGGERGTIETEWMDNLILDSGIAQLVSVNDTVIYYISVGAGSSAPSVGESTLVSKIAHTRRNWTVTHGFDSEGGYGWSRFQTEFAQGAAAGNISEIGAGWDGTNLFSRALVRDSGGDPTTVTVLSDEYLTVVYELRTWWVTPEPYTLKYDFDGTEEETEVTQTAPQQTKDYNGASAYYMRHNSISAYVADGFSYVNGVWQNPTANSVEMKFTIPVNYATSGVAYLGLDTIQVSAGSILPFYNSYANFATFDPPIMKTSDHEVTIVIKVTIGRKS